MIKQDRILTIAIPTYRRKEIIARGIRNIIDQGLNNICDILVVDDDSPDLTYEYLVKTFIDVPNLKIYKNTKRIGFAEQFYKLFSYCHTEYMLISSDEDWVLNIRELIAFLKEHAPDYLSGAVVERSGKFYRKKKSGQIALNDFRQSCNYISGTVYKIDTANQYIDKIKPLIGKNYIASLYPQILLVVYLIAMHRVLWFPEIISILKNKEKSYMVDLQGNPYAEPDSRKKQFKAIDVFLKGVLKDHPQYMDKIRQMWEAEKNLKIYR